MLEVIPLYEIFICQDTTAQTQKNKTEKKQKQNYTKNNKQTVQG